MNTLEMLVESGLHSTGQPLRLHLGCGQNKFKDYVNIDFPQDRHNVMITGADAEADIIKDLVFPENSVDEIRCHHMYEHFPRVIALAQLVKWHKWLKPEGVLVVETPDFISSVEQLIDADYKQRMAIVRHLTGDQCEDWAFHVDQWFDERFETTLSAFGFHVTNIKKSTWEVWPYLASVTVEAIKLNSVDIHKQIDIGLTLLKDSLVSEKEFKTFNIWKKQFKDALKDLV
jgi:predicted SAM-dependent methyltransferase